MNGKGNEREDDEASFYWQEGLVITSVNWSVNDFFRPTMYSATSIPIYRAHRRNVLLFFGLQGVLTQTIFHATAWSQFSLDCSTPFRNHLSFCKGIILFFLDLVVCETSQDAHLQICIVQSSLWAAHESSLPSSASICAFLCIRCNVLQCIVMCYW